MQPSFFTKEQIDKIVSLAIEAGEIAIKEFQEKTFSIKRKEDGSCVTSTDAMISEFFRKNFYQEFPEIPVICEEGTLREVAGDEFFLIDPIDGTSSFAKGSSEFCINIALIKNKKAVFGLIYAPLFEDGKMAFTNQNGRITLQKVKSGTSLEISKIKNRKSEKIRIITSSRSSFDDVKSHINNHFKEFLENFEIEKLSSAIKFFRVVEGDCDLYLHFRPSMEWDTAAGQALTESIGISPKHLSDGKILTYKKSGFDNPPFLLRSF